MTYNQFIHALQDALEDYEITRENGDWDDADARLQLINDLVKRYLKDDPNAFKPGI